MSRRRRTRRYRAPGGEHLVVWTEGGAFTVTPIKTETQRKYLKTLAPCPKGLAERVNIALRAQKGK